MLKKYCGCTKQLKNWIYIEILNMVLEVVSNENEFWAKFDKIESPFVREFNEKKEYKIINKVNTGFEWCFGNKDVMVTEKIDGTNSGFILHKDEMIEIFQRNSKTKIYGKLALYEANYKFILAASADYIARYSPEPETFHAGETIGEQLNGNPYKIRGHAFMEFKIFGTGHLPRYDFREDEYPSEPNPNAWREWLFKIKSKLTGGDYVEGVVFWHKKTMQMAKLRRDMF
jgi:hypothetical protein